MLCPSKGIDALMHASKGKYCKASINTTSRGVITERSWGGGGEEERRGGEGRRRGREGEREGGGGGEGKEKDVKFIYIYLVSMLLLCHIAPFSLRKMLSLYRVCEGTMRHINTFTYNYVTKHYEHFKLSTNVI